MKRLANIYIILFLLDGIISLVDMVTARCFGIHPLFAIRGVVAFFPFVLAFPLYCIIGCTRGFPWRVLFPMILFIIWVGLFFALPLPFFLGIQNTEFALSVAQVVLGILVLVGLRCSSQNGQWLYGMSAFEQLEFRWPRLFGFVAVNVFLVGPLLCIYVGVSASAGISHFSQGFVHLNAKGVSVEVRTYRHNDKKILLLPTVHIADRSFYSDLIAGLPPEKTVVIPEGVTDRKNLLANGMGYEKLATSLGLVAQDNQTLAAELPTNSCDIDISMLSPEVVDFLSAISALFHNSDSGNYAMTLLKSTSIPAPDINLLWKEIIEDRNRRVTDCIYDSLKNYDYVAVPWGAGHMPGIEKDLLAAGAVVVDSRRVWVWQRACAAPCGKSR